MKKFVARIYLFIAVIAVLCLECFWIGFFQTGNANQGSPLPARLLFPVLLVVGTVLHFRTR